MLDLLLSLLLLVLPNEQFLLGLQERFEVVLLIEVTEDVHRFLESNSYAVPVFNVAGGVDAGANCLCSSALVVYTSELFPSSDLPIIDHNSIEPVHS